LEISLGVSWLDVFTGRKSDSEFKKSRIFRGVQLPVPSRNISPENFSPE